MKEYNYKQIQHFDKNGIVFEDGTRIMYDECRKNWAETKGVKFEDTSCVAERNITAYVPYFLFYTNERIKVIFKKSILPWNTQYKKKFMNVQIKLNHLGYSTYDCS